MPREELLGTSLPDLASYWSESGRPGWVADRWLDGESVWTLAGLVRGTFRVDEPGRTPRRLIDASGTGSFTPLSWYDSLRVLPGVGAAGQGFQGALTTIEGRTGGAGPAAAEGIVDLRSGDGSWDENSIMVSKRDSLRWLRVESHGLKRGAAGTMDLGGRHLWGVSGGVRRGPHSLELAFSQQGVADRLLGTEFEDLSGQVGSGTYAIERRGDRGEVTFSRGLARSFSSSDDALALLRPSRRATATSELSGRMSNRAGFSAAARYDEEHVGRDLPAVTGTGTGDLAAATRSTQASSYWGTVGWAGEAGPGRLVVDVGGGKHDAFAHLHLAPAIRYEVRARGVIARVGAERVLNAAWSDLPAGHLPFLQRSLVGVADLMLGASRAGHVRAVVLAGRTTSRAVASRVPLSEAVLRTGWIEDPEPYTFAVGSVEARGSWRRCFGEASAFGLLRPARVIQPSVDPNVGARGIVGARWRLFKGDLGFQAYVGGDFVGARDSEFQPGRLPCYAVSTAALQFTLDAATITIRARNLEDRSWAEPWLDTSTGSDATTGSQAFGPTREIRFALTLSLRN